MNARRFGVLLVMIAAIGYSMLPIFTRTIYNTSELAPTDLAIWRFAFAVPFIWAFLGLRSRVQPGFKRKAGDVMPRIKLLLMGTIYAGAALAAFAGLQYVEASIFGVLFHTYPAMVAILGLFLGKHMSGAAWIALLLTFIGALLTVPDLSLAGDNVSLGIAIAFLNALIVAIYFLLVGNIMHNIASPARGSAWIMTGTLIVLSLFVPIFGLQVPQDTTTWLNIVGLAAFSTALPIMFINIGIQRIGAAQAAILTAFEPIGTLLLAMPILGESLLPIQWLGGVLIVAGVIVLEVRGGRKAAVNTA